MQKYIKAGMLTIVLALPAFLILFLHSFGENHFELPYFIPAVDSTGQTILNGKDTVFYQVPLKSKDSIHVVGFFEPSEDAIVAQHFSRVEKLMEKEVIFEVIRDNPIRLGQIYKVGNLKNVNSMQTIPYNEEFILLDKQGYIRGFYKAKDEKEIERLITEINVLLDIYQKNNN